MWIKRKPNPVWRFPVTSLDIPYESGIVASVASSEKARRNFQRAVERAERVVRRQPSPEHRRAVETARRLVVNAGSNVRMAEGKRIEEARAGPDPSRCSSNAR